MRHFFYFSDVSLANIYIEHQTRLRGKAKFLGTQKSINEEGCVFAEYHSKGEPLEKPVINEARKELRIYQCIKSEFNEH